MLHNISIGEENVYFMNKYVLHAIMKYSLYLSHTDVETHNEFSLVMQS